MPLPSERLSFSLIVKNEFSAPQSSLLVELALLLSPRGSPMSMPLPSEPELAVGRASIAPLTYRVTYEHAAPF